MAKTNFINNRDEEKYYSIKRVRPKNGIGGYVNVPSWLIGKKVIVGVENEGYSITKVVSRNAVITFPHLLINTRVEISLI